MQNTLKSNEWRRILAHEIFKSEIQKGWPNNSAVLQNWFLPRNQAPSIQVIQLFCKIGFPPHPWKVVPSLIWGISENWRELSTLNHVKYIYITLRFVKNFGPKWIISDVAVTWVGMTVFPLIWALEFFITNNM